MEKELLRLYNLKKEEIRARLAQFKKVDATEYFYEFIFCLLTPQSNARKCWQAVEKIKKLKRLEEPKIKEILKTHTRFHNNKTKYILEAQKNKGAIQRKISDENVVEARNWLAENIRGIGLKEAGHFLRNIGKSENKIAILDRHILRNLKELKIIKDEKIKNKRGYIEKEGRFLEYAEKIKIPADELDLLFWSKENGEIFK